MASKNVETFRAAHQAFNRRDYQAVVNLMNKKVRYEDRARGIDFTGRVGFTEFMEGWTTALSDAAVTSPTYIDGGDTVVALFRGRGTQDGPLGPLPSTGRKLDLAFCEIMRFDAQGQIVSGELYYDQMTLLTQLGHIEAAAVATV